LADYYRDKLAADRLKRVYEIAPPRIRQYLDAELNHVLSQLTLSDIVLDLGCGYGRTLRAMAEGASLVVGIDSSLSSLQLARDMCTSTDNVQLAQMDAAALGFADRSFDKVICIQNGISAFHRNQRTIIEEAFRVLRPGGTALF
jgi:ubiquinone/menaquinone biosynthesis C-methylase UbiE